MAGTRIEINHNSVEILQALNQLLQNGQDTTPAMAEIAGYMDQRTRENFDNEQTPDGIPWAPLSNVTQALRAEKGLPVDKILHGETINLRDEMHIYYDAETAEVRTGQPASSYAAMQQFGGTTSNRSMIPGVEIPARPYLGFSADDQGYILEILGDFLTNI
ncbi:MAG: phage virion morphogenesis protein [Neptuniibacter sp.]